MTAMPIYVRTGGPPPRTALARQGDADLDRLLAMVVDGRRAMQVELRLPLKRQRQIVVQGRLLAALESYALALSARGLLAPPKLRDELALHRGLAASQ